MCDIKTGTCGYDYVDWQGSFYPEGLQRDQFWAFYSRRFDTVEINSTAYMMPDTHKLMSMCDQAGGDMDFSLKAHEAFLRDIGSNEWQRAVDEYAESVFPLVESGRLSSVLLRVPGDFEYTPENRRHIDMLIRRIGPLPLTVEFQNRLWLNRRVFEELRKRAVGFCCVDAPRAGGAGPCVDIVTSDVAYVRFYGRNENGWWGSDTAARFDYDYSERELKGWADRIRAMGTEAKKIRVYFNNHHRGQAAGNALMMKRILNKE